MSKGGVRPPRVQSVEELCSLWDAAFIEQAYWILLGREPDPSGEAYYLNQLRDGAPKLKLIDSLRNSEEGQARDHGIAGLDEAIARYRKSTKSVSGLFSTLFGGENGNGRAARESRATANQRAAAYAEKSTRQQDLKLWKQVSSRLVGLAGLADKQGQVESTLAEVEKAVEQMNRRLIRIEAALKRIEGSGKRGPSPKAPSGRA